MLGVRENSRARLAWQARRSFAGCFGGTTYVYCRKGVPAKHDKTWWYGDEEQHKQARRDAAAHAKDVAEKYDCGWLTNY